MACIRRTRWSGSTCWLGDVSFAGADNTSFKCALVRLAVARYQPDSLDDL
nr:MULTISPECIES: hypothetical protein [Streptomyces]